MIMNVRIEIEGSEVEVANEARKIANSLAPTAQAMREVFRHAIKDPCGEVYSKLSLIKAVRAVTGLGLKEAKDIVEGY